MRSILLADCGHSAVKLALCSSQAAAAPRLAASQGCPYAGSHWQTLLRALSAHPQALLVSDRDRSSQLRAAWQQIWPQAPIYCLGQDLALPDCGQYPGFGSDRCCAGYAAAQSDSAIVIDMGTATTLTAWQPGPCLMGGLILPGRACCARGLQQAAPHLPLISQWPASDELDAQASLAMNTEQAMSRGLTLGYSAMIIHCLDQMQQASQITRLLLTGGDISALPADFQARCVLRPQLTLEGMARIAVEQGILS